MNKKNTKKEQGVVLLEAIVAIGVLILIVTASLDLVISSSSSVRTAGDRLVATQLAQDATEWIIAKKQYNEQRSFPWLTDLDCTGFTTCAVESTLDVNSYAVFDCATGLYSCTLHRASAVPHWYTHSTAGAAVATIFTREVSIVSSNIDGVAGDDEAEIVVMVSWPSGSGTEEVSLTTTIYAQ